MATLEKVNEVILAFAKANIFTSSPDTIDSAIVPAPSAMNTQIFQDFFAALSAAVGAGGITCNHGFQCVKDSKTWIDVSNCVFFSQTGGVLSGGAS